MFSGFLWALMFLLQIADFLRCLQARNCFPILMAVMTLAVINPLAAATDAPLPGNTGTRDSTSHPLGFGTVFLQHGKLAYNGDYWLHSFKISLPHSAVLPEQSKPCQVADSKDPDHHSNGITTRSARFHPALGKPDVNDLPTTTNSECPINTLLEHYYEIRGNVADQIKTSADMVRNLLPHVNLPSFDSRSRRALFPFLGNIISSITGLAKESDLSKIAHSVQVLAKQADVSQNAFAHETTEMKSYMKIEKDRMDKAVHEISLNHAEIITLSDHISQLERSLDQTLQLIRLFSD